MLHNDHFWPYWRDVLDYTGKDMEMNFAGISSIKFQNLILDRRNYLRSVVKAIEVRGVATTDSRRHRACPDG